MNPRLLRPPRDGPGGPDGEVVVSDLVRTFARACLPALAALLVAAARAEPVELNLPAQSAAEALLAFARQAKVEILFSYDDLRTVRSHDVIGRFEPEEALSRLLQGTGFIALRSEKGKFVVMRARRLTGSVRGKLLTPDGLPARGVRVSLPQAGQATETDRRGEFLFGAVLPGYYRLQAGGGVGFPLQPLTDVRVLAGREALVDTQTIAPEDSVTHLDPYVVVAESSRTPLFDGSDAYLGPRVAGGNLDLPRTADDALPYAVYTRNQIARSGVVNLNEFIQRELPDSNATNQAPDENGNAPTFDFGSTNLNLRAYGEDETVVLVNGRRLPEIVNSAGAATLPPDVNFIPLSLVQQIEVLPASAAALYSGNPVGGVINIVLRPDPEGPVTEVSSTYTNALRFDAPQSSISLLHGRTLLGGALRVRLSATFTRTQPANEEELGYIRANVHPAPTLGDAAFGATPNIRSANSVPLFGPGTATVTSVAAGADGGGGLAAFAGREGLRNLALFDSTGGFAASPDSLDYPYGRKQRRSTYFGSATYDALPWLQVGLDGIYSRTVASRGFDVFAADLALPAASPFNPFGQDVRVALNETAPALGQNYSEARTEFASAVLGLLLKLPSDWRVSLDAQYGHNLSKYRGVYGADSTRWQRLVDAGSYNPLRDTQVHGPPPQFYDQVLIYYGSRGRFVTLGNYDTVDASARVTNQTLALPTGLGAVNAGVDYRRMHLADFANIQRYGDGTLAADPVLWQGRILQRYSAFGEIQAPLWPARRRPRWLKRVESDLAVRYVASASSRESYLAPTGGFKVDLRSGFTLRGSFTYSNRYPTPFMSRQAARPSDLGSGQVSTVQIYDPARNQTYDVASRTAINPELHPEAAATQTVGVIFARGRDHRLRLALDFVDTRKTNEIIALDPQTLVDLEALFPGRVQRAPPAPGDTGRPGLIGALLTGDVNAARRHSQNWNASADYQWTRCAGGTLSLYGRLIWFQQFGRQVYPDSPVIDELRLPDGWVDGLLRYRTNFGANWADSDTVVGVAGHYFSSRVLPQVEWSSQGSDRVGRCWQFDAFVQRDLKRWLPWKARHFDLRGQLRVNNLFGADLPHYANDPSGAGVQPYGDWRGRTYSVSLTAEF